MSALSQAAERPTWFYVRQRFLLACAEVIAGLILPDAIQGRRGLQGLVLFLASIAGAFGWFFVWRNREPNSTWRRVIAVSASLCLMIAISDLFFELSQHWPSREVSALFWMYARRWEYWYVALASAGFAGTFCGRGSARAAFVVASALLLILRLSLY